MIAKRPFLGAESDTLAAAVARFAAAGWSHELRADEAGLLDAATGQHLRPEDLVVDEVVRLEGSSDPDEESIVLAVHERVGPLRATWATAYGSSAPEADAEMLARLPTRPG